MAFRAEQLLGKWAIDALYVADEKVNLSTQSHFLFEPWLSMVYKIERSSIEEPGRWHFDISNNMLTLTFFPVRFGDNLESAIVHQEESIFSYEVVHLTPSELQIRTLDQNGISSVTYFVKAPK